MSAENQLVLGGDNKLRCQWSNSAPQYPDYHDNEWGFPTNDDFLLFEKLSLESFQSGLSWRTILGKRENFRAAFDQFNFNKIAQYSEQDSQRLLLNEGIVRNPRKIAAVINNANVACQIVNQYGSLAAFLWAFKPNSQDLAPAQSLTISPASIALANALKKQGWKFIGPTTAFAFMQSMGFFNDHFPGCCVHQKVAEAIRNFTL
ncbi:DNA-3-methyladenine glycosylase I [Gammaproteobacteria bacterium AS21]